VTSGARSRAGALLATVGVSAHAAPLPFKPEQADSPGAPGLVGALLVCGVAIVALLVLARRFWPGLRRAPRGAAEAATLQLQSSLRLNPQVQLAVVVFEQQRLLLAVTTTSATVLERAPVETA
jgi:hypothetical protein